MSELFTSGSVGGGAGNCPFYPAADRGYRPVGKRRDFFRLVTSNECSGLKRRVAVACLAKFGYSSSSVLGKGRRVLELLVTTLEHRHQ